MPTKVYSHHGKKGAKSIGIFLFLFIFCFCSLPIQAKQLYTTDGVNVRKKPKADSKVKTTVSAGTAVTRTGKSGNWIAVSVDGVSGYIYKDYLSTSPVSVSDTSSGSSSYSSYINSTEVNLRKKANDHCKVKAVLEKGETVTVLSTSGNWTKIKRADGMSGYVFSTYLGKKASSSQPSKSDILSGYRSSAISYAKGCLGDIYSQENRDSDGYADCSSLVRNAYSHASGQYIGDTTVGQTETMMDYFYELSSIYDATPGDLLYHLSDDNHAGIYLGNGKVLHASQTAGVVKISTYDSESTYWEYGCNAAAYCYDN